MRNRITSTHLANGQQTQIVLERTNRITTGRADLLGNRVEIESPGEACSPHELFPVRPNQAIGNEKKNESDGDYPSEGKAE